MSFFNPSKKHNKIVLFILLGSFCLLIFSSCTAKYVKGDYIREEEIPNSKKIISTKYEFKILKPPTVTEPEVKLSIVEIPKYQEKYRNIYEERKYEVRGVTHKSLGISFLTIAGLSLWMALVSSTDDNSNYEGENNDYKSQKESEAKVNMWIGIGGTLLFGSLGIGLLTSEDENIVYRGVVGTIKDQPKTRYWEGSQKSLNNYSLSASLNNSIIKKYNPNKNGNITINLVKDFNLGHFQNHQPINFHLVSKEFNLHETISLNPKDWTKQYVQIKNNRTPLKSAPRRTSQTSHFLDAGTEYEVNNVFKEYYQIIVNGKTRYISKNSVNSFWSIPERLDPKNPPNLIVKHVEFSDPSNDQFLDAEESGIIKVYLKNIGRGNAYRVGLKVSADENSASQLSYPEYVTVGTIKPGEAKTVKVPVEASSNTLDGKTTFQLNAREANGFDAQPVSLTLQKRAFRPPVLEVADYGIDDSNNNGRIELGEAFDVTVRIRNKGTGAANKVVAQVNLDKSAQNIFYDGYTNNFDLNNLKPGEFKDVRFSILTNNRYKMNYIPITITLKELKGKYGNSIPLNLPLDRSVKRSQEIRIAGKTDNSQMIIPIDDLTPDVDMNIPVTKNKNPNAVAVIIGLSKYQNRNIPQVDYAKRDAAIIKEYLLKTFGYDKKKIIELYDYNATLASFRRVFEEQLPNFTQGNDVFIYYSGHGVPDLKTEEAYFAPYDFNPSYTKSTGYKLNDFYKSLRSLKARSITVVLDACFSGMSEGGQIYKGISPINIRVKNQSLLLNNGFVLTSSTGNQVSTWYHEKKHGLFTYFLLKGLRGDADSNKDRKIILKEMSAYLSKMVSEAARYKNREQNPQIFGDPAGVLLTY